MIKLSYPNVPINSECLHQGVLDAAYLDWQKNDGINSYDDMLKNARFKYGEFAEFLVLFGKFNQQVCNGGHSQYWSNGYASSDTDGFGCDHEDSDLHDRLIRYSKIYLPQILNNELYSEIIRILETPVWNDIDDEQFYTETYEEYNEETDEYEEVEEEVYNDNYGSFKWDTNALDLEYYKINDEILATISGYLKGLVTNAA